MLYNYEIISSKYYYIYWDEIIYVDAMHRADCILTTAENCNLIRQQQSTFDIHTAQGLLEINKIALLSASIILTCTLLQCQDMRGDMRGNQVKT